MNRDQKHPLEDTELELAWERFRAAAANEQIAPAWLEEPATNGPADKLNSGAGHPADLFVPGFPGNQTDKVHRATTKSGWRSRRVLNRGITAASAAVLAGLLFVTPLGQNVMASVMHTFRLQKLEVVEIDQADLMRIRDALTIGVQGSQTFDLSKYGDLQQQSDGTARTVTFEEAGKLSGGKMKRMPGASGLPIRYQPEQRLVFRLHTEETNKLMALLGGKTKLPDALDGKPVTLSVPGTFRIASDTNGANKQLIQLPVPDLKVPDGVDIEQVRQSLLGLPVLPEDLRAKLSAIGDWRHTLPVPALAGQSTAVSLDGNNAILTHGEFSRSIVWLQDGWMYQLSGSAAAYPNDQSIIEEARVMIRS